MATNENGPWVCFHCSASFVDPYQARMHFGATEDAKPACAIKGSEGGLVRALREAEEVALDAIARVHAESADGINAWRNAQSRNRQAVVSAEEAGYERGLADQARTVEILRRALAWHGDPVRMATTREEWQQEVDEAIRWVRDNPEEGGSSFSSYAGEAGAQEWGLCVHGGATGSYCGYCGGPARVRPAAPAPETSNAR